MSAVALGELGALVFHWLRREWVLDREVRRFGTATSGLLFWTGRGRLRLVAQTGQGRPPWVDRIVRVIFGKVGEPLAAIGAQARAVVAAQRAHRQLEHQGITQHGLEVDQIVHQLRQLVVIVGLGPVARELRRTGRSRDRL